MTTTISPEPAEQVFAYRGCRFLLAVRPVGAAHFLARVLYRSGLPGIDSTPLPEDADPYASAEEALRHAEQQAVRWVHDRTGHGTGQL